VSAYILDASVAAKWFLPPDDETFVKESLDLLNGYSRGTVRLTVPDLFWTEFGNILWRSARVGRISIEAAEEALVALIEKPFPTLPSLPLLDDAFTHRNAIPMYCV
jgi:predicted nucleic acid-binding protein